MITVIFFIILIVVAIKVWSSQPPSSSSPSSYSVSTPLPKANKETAKSNRQPDRKQEQHPEEKRENSDSRPQSIPKTIPASSKPNLPKQDTEKKVYRVGDVYYCWNYLKGQLSKARIIHVFHDGVDAEVDSETKRIQFWELNRRFYSNPEEVPEFRDIRQRHPYQPTEQKESAQNSNQAFQGQVNNQQDASLNKSVLDHVGPVTIDRSCNNCMLRKGGQCSQVRNILCEDYRPLPDAPQIKIGRQISPSTAQEKNPTAKEHHEAKPTLSDLKGTMVWIDVPGGGNGTIVSAEPLVRSNKQDIKIDVLFENGAKKSFVLSICCRNRWFEIVSGTVRKEDLKVYFDRLEAEQRATEKANREKAQKEREEQSKKLAEKREAERKAEEQKRIEAIVKERREAYSYLAEERKVQYLVHFTPVGNLQSILNTGIIPRSALIKNRVQAEMTDETRIDNRPDCTSFSVSFPNYRMMFKKSNNFKFALLLIDPKVLLDLSIEPVFFLPDNAARMQKYGLENYKGLDALKMLFSETVTTSKGKKTREELQIPDCFPSNPQAEIFMGGTVKPKYIKAVVVESLPDAEELSAKLFLPVGWSKSMIGYSTSYFKPRCDYIYWQQEKRADSEVSW